MTTLDRPIAGFWLRLAAIFYDSLLLFSVLYFATLVILFFNDGKAIPPNQPLYTTYLLVVSYIYFGWFWTHGGQTLGMRAWRIRLRCKEGGTISWRQALLRFVTAAISWVPAGAGYFWSLVDRERMSWHDRLSGTVLIKDFQEH